MNSWTPKKDKLLETWASHAIQNKKMCERSCADYKKKHKSINIPIIILTGISAAGNFSAESFVQFDLIKNYLKWINMVLGIANTTCVVLNNFLNTFNYSSKADKFDDMSEKWSQFIKEIEFIQALSYKERNDSIQYIKETQKEYTRLEDETPPYDEKILNEFRQIERSKDTDMLLLDINNYDSV